ncbi:DMSO/TMAO reductase YedYZ molybdopterin-dependent catalytic subunit [Allocatelliglobosispora scoriae]|uniref:DMSO/TMAO reductase YedYZ molybdopterin-dependent catalytic subunit n=1 Tax=Allocatelliglobosispora scoriae TaxID=643052 RepID=A0A841BMM9_9ACTN|nr:molybdopterin-dependent oxidoreductase [Allocatelliglobosispora scoriae]MBB5868080.1 DMSO/TMAO reductase YedYZ molybdopterin-dependent catalytic subunit [Allocatelliglobosispora scoriae]
MVRLPDHLNPAVQAPKLSKRFTSKLRSARLTSQLGIATGVAFGICLLTGYISHAIQHPPWWFAWPSRPISLYRVTQGLHVATGLIAVPLLAAKLWSVYPKLFRWPPLQNFKQNPLNALERGSLILLVAGAIFQLTTGILNIARWYAPMGFFFTTVHFWTAWITIGALLIHIATKLPIVRRALTAPIRPVKTTGLTRRGLLTGVGAAAGAVTVATIGQTVRPLAAISVLAPRDPRIGPQGFPVNTPATSAGVTESATSADYRLTLTGPAGSHTYTVDQLRAMPQHESELPITCVEGWSATAHWTGVRLRDLVAIVGGDDDSQVTVTSLQLGSLYSTSTVAPPHASNPLTLLALGVNGEQLALDHGFPCRLIAPNRPGVMQTKWVTKVEVSRP